MKEKPQGCKGKRLSKTGDKLRDNFSVFEPNQIPNKNEESKDYPNSFERKISKPEANFQIHAQEEIRKKSLEYFMEKQLNMKNVFASSVHLLENTQDSLELTNFTEPRDFFKIPLHDDIDHSYADHYNKIIDMIQNDKIDFANFESTIDYLTDCKNSIVQNTLPYLYHNLISLLQTQIQSPSPETYATLHTHISRI